MFVAFIEIQSKLYANSFLGSLNACKQLMKSSHYPNAYASYELSRKRTRMNVTTPIIKVFRETTRIADSPETPTKSSMSTIKESYAV
ncbi:hypothetical protein NEOLEDRAFT_1143849 [Neolentinus lepideus HHB14362 ss-1]|uniref:Uncharacterized protein n=1 Tax=Neolentinus lepideus HHB14362 ss-1 TaxID=1314782 RepID=A0A165MA54_9AGAM|nr:hypothetical protein NEOLEDRAFT_1143849 [Neolentinus lepideus HHB14362 ss-1]